MPHPQHALTCDMSNRNLKGLDKIIGLSVVDFLMGPNGWKFSEDKDCPGAIPDNINNAQYLRELYFKAEPGYNGRYTVPVLWDKKKNTIVNNESSEIIRMLNIAFDAFSSAPGVTYYPENLRPEIDAINEWIYNDINNGVYKSGFATTQEAYEKNCKQLFKSLDRVEGILKENEWLVGGVFTEADLRLFTTIVRFDPVYVGHFKCNLGTIQHDFPSILRWARQIYQIPGIKDTINMYHIKHHYYMSHVNINPTQVVPLSNGPDLSVPVKFENKRA
ncbi:S-glutathionyl-(chloro)hydroquinone reductase [Rhizophlyctis rosea]|uniref:S-glutathionyl-(Chloro)hydroquinone reductase n=1 Tax=Rhizophlyctis rosea TaxID=64517 RepID=A0AAD5SHR5_9FUNG|nr:S-glutathionyl-(chloro)hydroquinone reductase [Rhizophlyctis rosea]